MVHTDKNCQFGVHVTAISIIRYSYNIDDIFEMLKMRKLNKTFRSIFGRYSGILEHETMKV